MTTRKSCLRTRSTTGRRVAGARRVRADRRRDLPRGAVQDREGARHGPPRRAPLSNRHRERHAADAPCAEARLPPALDARSVDVLVVFCAFGNAPRLADAARVAAERLVVERALAERGELLPHGRDVELADRLVVDVADAHRFDLRRVASSFERRPRGSTRARKPIPGRDDDGVSIDRARSRATRRAPASATVPGFGSVVVAHPSRCRSS